MNETDRIIVKLERLNSNVAAAAEGAVLKGVEQIRDDAKRLAPVKTGRLRDSMAADVRRDGETDITGKAGTGVEYAAYVELGAGKQFLYPAFKKNQAEIRRSISNAVISALREGGQ